MFFSLVMLLIANSMNNTVDTFIALLRSAIIGTNENIDLLDVNYEALYSLAIFHDLAHIVYYELKQRGFLHEGEIARKFEYQKNMAQYRYVLREVAIEQVRSIFEEAKIPFVLLKGAMLMNLYPEPWMRTSSDIDVLVKEEDLSNAENALICFGMKRDHEGRYDVSFFSKEKYHIELHYTMLEDYTSDKICNVMKKAWNYFEPIKSGASEYVMRDELFYFYHIAHMAKHFKNGGNGVRTVIDLWLLNHKIAFDQSKRVQLITEGDLATFNDKMVKLLEKWFSKNESIDHLDTLEEYIIQGGIYGTTERKIAITRKKAGNRLTYYINRAFPPYSILKHAFPVLKRFPFLIPFGWIIRWFKLLNPTTRRRTSKEIMIEQSVDKAENGKTKKIEMLMKELEIW